VVLCKSVQLDCISEVGGPCRFFCCELTCGYYISICFWHEEIFRPCTRRFACFRSAGLTNTVGRPKKYARPWIWLAYLLKSYGVPARMVIGARQMPFRAHAWVEVNGRVVNDKPYVREMYAVLDRC
jgi:hypothetical protein